MSNGTPGGSSSAERRVDEARGRLDASLDALQQKFSPGQMVDEAMSYFRHGSGAEFGRNLTRSVREQPLPVALVGVGLAWLMFTGSGGQRHDGATSNVSDRAHDAGATMGERTRQSADALRGGAASVGSSLGEGRRAAASGVQSTARSLGSAGSETMALLERQPLLAAAFGVTAGALLASLFPTTEGERELLSGPAQAAREQVGAIGDKASRVAGQAADAAKDAARDEQSSGTHEHTTTTASSQGSSPRDRSEGPAASDTGAVSSKPTSPFSS